MTGQTIGSYRVVDKLGEGGMGEVFRARDEQLNRDVAIKVLRAEVASDADRLQRFVREAQTLAALNHPNIAQIYGLAGGGQALVMELVEGEDLAQRLARGPIPLEDALPIARQIAEALEAAHEIGIVHRDLKPANIKLRSDGTVKVLDFGLAKALDRSRSSASDVLNSPTITSPAMTQAGIILGTAAYMSPEQARGKPVDRRADIWAFGAVLFEMLTGQRPFAGDTVTDVIAAVVTKSPDWNALPHNTPPAIAHLVRRCLEKDARVRLRDIGEARVALASDSSAVAIPPDAISRAVSRPGLIARVLPWAVAVIALAVAIASWLWNAQSATPVRKIEVALPANATLVSLSPNGSQIAFRVQNHIRVKDLRTLDSRDVASAPMAQANVLVWSPDSSSVAYNTVDRKLWRVSTRGGPAQIIADIPETGQALFAAWAVDDSIVLSVWRGGLYRVPAAGGTPAVITPIDPKADIDFHFPLPLPDGRVMVATHLIDAPGGSPNVYRIEILSSGSREPLAATGFFPLRYLDSGHLLVQRFDVNEGLWRVPYRPNAALNIAEGQLVAAGANSISVSDDGLLLYAVEGDADTVGEMVWVDRNGRIVGQIGVEQKRLSAPALSPDKSQVAYSAAAGDDTDIWIRDLQSNLQSRVTSESDDELEPTWFPLADRLLYREMPVGIISALASRLVTRKRDGAERAEVSRGLAPLFSPDGKFVLFLIDDRGSLRLRRASMQPNGAFGEDEAVIKTSPEPVITGASISPSGNLIAYVEPHPGGRPEVYVTRFPQPEGRWQVSVSGGRAPIWSRSGELFFVGGANTGPKQMMAVQIDAGATVKASTPLKLFDIPGELQTTPTLPASSGKAAFDVSADGQQFLMVRNRTDRNENATRWILVENWLADVAPGRR